MVTQIASRSYDVGGRFVTTTAGNGLVETRTYNADNTVATLAVPGVTNFGYTYDSNKRKTYEGHQFAADLQTFAYDDENGVIAWTRDGQESQSWTLTKVGDWSGTTRNGVAQTRTHSNVHETTGITSGGVTTPLSYDAKGNLTQDHSVQRYAWDVENRLVAAVVGAATNGYFYDALGRRLAKAANGLATTFVHDGAQVIDEYEAPIYQSQDIGWPSLAGSFSDSGAGTVTVSASGNDIWNTSDQFRYAYFTLTGNGSIIAKVTTQTNTDPWAKAGVMLRDSLSADAKHAFMCITPGNGAAFQRRTTTGGASDNNHTGGGTAAVPYWVCLTRSGSTVSGYRSADGVTWTLVGSDTVTFTGQTIYAGLAVTAHTNSAVSTATFTNVAATGWVSTSSVPGLARTYVYGTYVDELLAMQTGVGGNDISTYTACASENGSFTLTGVCDVAYGANGSYVFRSGQSGTITFNNATFGDPIVGVYKQGFYRTTTKLYAHANHLHSVAALTDPAGSVVERYRYDAYGQRTALAADGVTARASSSYANQIGFTGRYLDKETGLWYFRARFYSASLGSFLKRDDWGYVDGSTLYHAYFLPNALDPTGNAAKECGQIKVEKDGKADPGHYPVKITYEPKDKTPECCCCEEIAFMQLARITQGTRKNGHNLPNPFSTGGMSGWFNRRITQHGSNNIGWGLDRRDNMTIPWMGYGNDGKPTPQITPGKCLPPNDTKNAVLKDNPGSGDNAFRNHSFWFITCAVCKKGQGKGKVLACITWNFSIDKEGEVTPGDPGPSTPEVPGQLAFAGELWNDQARRNGNIPMGGSSDRQEPWDMAGLGPMVPGPTPAPGR